MSGPLPNGVEREARALGDPTRYRIFRHIGDARRQVGVAELTALVSLNHNAVRQHLAVLKAAGLIVEGTEERNCPGRPRLLYRLNPGIRGTWGTDGPYELLAALLSEVVRTQAAPREVGRAAGRRRARQDPRHHDSSLVALEEDMAAAGFDPVAIPRPGGCDFVLGRCPFVDVAAKDPATVCQLHLGLVEGMATSLDDGAVVDLVAKNARQAGCRVRVRHAGVENTSPEGGTPQIGGLSVLEGEAKCS
ncbi:MAG TPA: helix-turn-helix domain-containing protein [Acidimicrobiales bacterium]